MEADFNEKTCKNMEKKTKSKEEIEKILQH